MARSRTQNRRRKTIARSALQIRRSEEIANINKWKIPACCDKKNCGIVLGSERVRNLRVQFLERDRDGRKSLLLQFVEPESPHEISIDGFKPCWNFLQIAFELSTQLITNCLRLNSANASHLPGRMGGVQSSICKASQVMTFLTELADAMADELPNAAERHLPHGNKNIVYSFYCERSLALGHEPCTKPYFYSIWRKHRSYVKCRRQHSFSCCDTCIMFKERLIRLSNSVSFSSKERADVMNGFRRHLKFIRNERATYALHCLKPLKEGSKSLSVIIDGADQSKFGLPRFPTTGKRETGISMKQKVTGVLFHKAVGGEDFLRLFTSPPNLIRGTNQTIDALCRGLFALKEWTIDSAHIFSPDYLLYNWITLRKTTRTDISSDFASISSFVDCLKRLPYRFYQLATHMRI